MRALRVLGRGATQRSGAAGEHGQAPDRGGRDPSDHEARFLRATAALAGGRAARGRAGAASGRLSPPRDAHAGARALGSRFYGSWFATARACGEARPRSVWLGIEPGGRADARGGGARRAGVPEALTGAGRALAVTAGGALAAAGALVAAGRLEGETQHTLYFRDPDGRQRRRVVVSAR